MEQDLTINDLFEKYNFYYIKDYPVSDALKGVTHDLTDLKTTDIAKLFYNIDFRMLGYLGETNNWIESFVESFFYLVTSFDKEGFLYPVSLSKNVANEILLHPGGKRACIGAYLRCSTIPAILQTKATYDNYTLKIESMADLKKLYPDVNITTIITDGESEDSHMHVETHYLHSDKIDLLSMNSKEYKTDGWMEAAQNANGSGKIPIYEILENGLNIVGDFDKNLTPKRFTYGTKKQFITKYTREPINDYYIRLYDMTLKNYNFWNLIWYFDPRYKRKYTIDNRFEICIDDGYASEEMLSNHLVNTLTVAKDRLALSNQVPILDNLS